MILTKLEKIALGGALASFAVSEVGESLNSPNTQFLGAVSMAVCAGYALISQTIGYYQDIKKMELDYNMIERIEMEINKSKENNTQ